MQCPPSYCLPFHPTRGSALGKCAGSVGKCAQPLPCFRGTDQLRGLLVASLRPKRPAGVRTQAASNWGTPRCQRPPNGKSPCFRFPTHHPPSFEANLKLAGARTRTKHFASLCNTRALRQWPLALTAVHPLATSACSFDFWRESRRSSAFCHCTALACNKCGWFLPQLLWCLCSDRLVRAEGVRFSGAVGDTTWAYLRIVLASWSDVVT